MPSLPTMNTPGVYVVEDATFPPSIAQVATAIPAFIGYTEKGPANKVQIAQVTSLLEYESIFGTTKPTTFPAADADGVLAPSTKTPEYCLWYAIDLYFRNGGGRCYVVSVGNTSIAIDASGFKNGLDAIEREDEPTLLVMPEAVALDTKGYGTVCQLALAQCGRLRDRFVILDVKEDAKVTPEKEGDPQPKVADICRTMFGNENLSFGAAYYPSLNTSLTHLYDEETVKVGGKKMSELKGTGGPAYSVVKKALGQQRVTLPASAAIAGVYVRVDRERGVWKAPANVSLQSVIGPTVQVTHEEQDQLNVVPDNGKSINAVRAFAGRGTMVWGARTLAGNDLEWRYVPVRRLFLTIEESAKKATSFAVFEPNDATTWLKVKGMIESYLYGLWEQGALQGSKPEAAYYVNVGLGKTMSPTDILEGRMIVEIGIAAVRPAEFILLRFSHKLAQA